MDPEQANVSFEQVLGVLRRRIVWILLCFVVASGVAFAYSHRKPKEYTATAAVAFSTDPLSQQIAGLSSPTGTGSVVSQQDSNLELVRLGDMAAKTATLLGHGLTDAKVAESVSVGAKGETDVIDVSATSTSPTLAAAIANTYTSQFVKEQRTGNSTFLKSALTQVNRQLAALPPTQRFGTDALDLQERAQTLRFLAALGYSTAQMAGEAQVPTSASSPKTGRNTLLGALAGLVLGFGLAFLLERFDRRIRETDDLEVLYRLPLLGVVPESVALSRLARENEMRVTLPSADAEAFSLIRAHLRFFNVDRDVRTVVIASPAPGDGKSTIARHLAEAAARLGSRVLLLEVDLRQPTLAQQLGIESGPGLAGVLIGSISIRDATHSISLEAPPGEGSAGRVLDVLVAGAVLPPNPGELLGSHAMDIVLAQAKSAYDFVVVDTPPLTAVSDAFPLLTKVDGVVIVGWIGRSRRAAAEQLHQVLASSGAPLLGVVANGAKSGGPNPYVGAASSSSLVSSANGATSSERMAPTAKT
jgi:capsular exopolysaccharide synthesis family protein